MSEVDVDSGQHLEPTEGLPHPPDRQQRLFIPYPKTGYVFANGEHIVPVSGVGTWNDPKTWNAVYTAIDGETMDIAWQVRFRPRDWPHR